MLSVDQIEELRKRLEKTLRVKIRPKTIKSIRVNPSNRFLPNMYIEVGKFCKNLEADAPVEEVVAIFDSTLFLVCTQNRGIEKGLPYFFARQDVYYVEEVKQ